VYIHNALACPYTPRYCVHTRNERFHIFKEVAVSVLILQTLALVLFGLPVVVGALAAVAVTANPVSHRPRRPLLTMPRLRFPTVRLEVAW
jgi:hypothetical protein